MDAHPVCEKEREREEERGKEIDMYMVPGLRQG
jgi:hypothetical protein